MGPPWAHHGPTTDPPWTTTDSPWTYHGPTMNPPWIYYGPNVDKPRTHH